MGARYFSMMRGPWLVSRWVLLVIVFVRGGGVLPMKVCGFCDRWLAENELGFYFFMSLKVFYCCVSKGH